MLIISSFALPHYPIHASRGVKPCSLHFVLLLLGTLCSFYSVFLICFPPSGPSSFLFGLGCCTFPPQNAMGSIAMPSTLSSDDGSASPPDTADIDSQPSKRSAADAGLKANGARPTKSVKRRASKACQCCRARKVRCNVVEHGPPCTNCRLDEVECIVSESKRKKYVILHGCLCLDFLFRCSP